MAAVTDWQLRHKCFTYILTTHFIFSDQKEQEKGFGYQFKAFPHHSESSWAHWSLQESAPTTSVFVPAQTTTTATAGAIIAPTSRLICIGSHVQPLPRPNALCGQMKKRGISPKRNVQPPSNMWLRDFLFGISLLGSAVFLFLFCFPTTHCPPLFSGFGVWGSIKVSVCLNLKECCHWQRYELLPFGLSCELDCDFERSDSFSVRYVLYFAFQVILDHPYHFHPSRWRSLFRLRQARLTPRLESRHAGRRLLHREVNIILEIDSPLDREPCDVQDFSLHDAQCHFLFDSHSWVPSFPAPLLMLTWTHRRRHS